MAFYSKLIILIHGTWHQSMLPIQVMDLWHKASNGTQLELAWYYWFLKLFIRVTAQQWKRIASKEITRVQRILKLLETRGFPSSKTESSAHVLIRLNGLECASLDFPSISSHLVIWYAGQQINKASVYTCSASSIIFPEAIRAFNHVVLHICTTSPGKKPNQMVGVI